VTAITRRASPGRGDRGLAKIATSVESSHGETPRRSGGSGGAGAAEAGTAGAAVPAAGAAGADACLACEEDPVRGAGGSLQERSAARKIATRTFLA